MLRWQSETDRKKDILLLRTAGFLCNGEGSQLYLYANMFFLKHTVCFSQQLLQVSGGNFMCDTDSEYPPWIRNLLKSVCGKCDVVFFTVVFFHYFFFTFFLFCWHFRPSQKSKNSCISLQANSELLWQWAAFTKASVVTFLQRGRKKRRRICIIRCCFFVVGCRASACYSCPVLLAQWNGALMWLICGRLVCNRDSIGEQRFSLESLTFW